MRVSGAMTMRLGRSRSPMRRGVKRGWTDMTAPLDKGSSGDDEFAGLLARLDEAMGVSDPVDKSANSLMMTRIGKCQASGLLLERTLRSGIVALAFGVAITLAGVQYQFVWIRR